jgi:hypothetical protein
MKKPNTLSKKIKGLGLILTIPVLMSAQAHVHPVNPIDPASVQINNNSCSGILYRSEIWDVLTTAPLDSRQSPPACNSRDSCGQFGTALNFSESFCHSKTQALTSVIVDSELQTYFHAPQNFVQSNLRTNYILTENVNFSCDVCAQTEHVQLEIGDNVASSFFYSGQSIFLRWWSDSPYSINSPYNNYIIQTSKRPLNSSNGYQFFATIKSDIGSFGLFDLTSELYNYQTQQLQFSACHEYEITLTVQAANSSDSYNSTHSFKLYDHATCPRTIQAQPIPIISLQY